VLSVLFAVLLLQQQWALPPEALSIATTTTASGAQGSGRGPAGDAGGVLVAGLNEDQSRDILREESAGD